MKTGRPCRVCDHPQRPKIDAAMLRGEPIAALVSLYGIGRSNFYRHRKHLRPTETASTTPAPGKDDSAKSLRLVVLRTLQIAKDAETHGTRRETLAALRQVAANLELVAKIRATEPPPYDPARDELVIQLRDRIARTLAECPTCRQKVADDFRQIAEAAG